MSGRSNWPSSRPAVQPSSRPQAADESVYQSRIEREKITPRLPRHLVEKARIYCAVNHIDLQDVVEEGLKLFFANVEIGRPAVEIGRPAVQPSSVVCDDQDLDLNTHNNTTTQRGRPAVQPSPGGQPLLNGVSAELVDISARSGKQPRSKFSLAENRRYAWRAHHSGNGIRNPVGWALSNFYSGKFDELVAEFLKDPERYFSKV